MAHLKYIELAYAEKGIEEHIGKPEDEFWLIHVNQLDIGYSSTS